jgi:lipopolysaccharide transport system permease protein
MVRRLLPRRATGAPLVVSRRVPRPLTGPPVSLTRHRPGPWEAVRLAWRDRRVVPWLSMRVVAKGFAGTRLGRSWLLLRPALELGGMTLLFGAVFNAPSEGLPYFMFLLTGMVSYRLFQVSALFGARSIQYYRRHVGTLSFATLLVPISASAIAVVDLAIYGGILAGTIGWFAVFDQNYLQFGPELLLAPASLVLILLFAWGLSFWLSIIVAYVLDVRVLLRYVFSLWMLVTPVLYPLSFVPDGLRDIALANPLTPFVLMFKWSLFGIGSVPLTSLYVALGVTAALLASGVWFHSRHFWGALASMSRVDDDEEEFLV